MSIALKAGFRSLATLKPQQTAVASRGFFAIARLSCKLSVWTQLLLITRFIFFKNCRFKYTCNDDNSIGRRKQQKLAYHVIVTCKFPITSLQCHVVTTCSMLFPFFRPPETLVPEGLMFYP